MAAPSGNLDFPSKMQALVKEAKGQQSYVYKQVDVPEPGPGELLVKVSRVGICGSDIHFYKWTSVADMMSSVPFTPGHEMVGEIVSRGEGVSDEFAPGNRVCVENHFYCGKCYQCTNDQRHICQNMLQFGHGLGTPHGGCSEYTILPAKYAYLLTTDISDDEAVLLEPFGVAHQAVEEIGVERETVLVQGCGPIGLLAIGIARAFGAGKILAVDIFDEKLEKAKKMGADVTINSKSEILKEKVFMATEGNGVGRLIEASGFTPAINSCFELLRKGGSIVLIGLPKTPIHIEEPVKNLIWKSLTLKTVHGRKIFHTWRESENMMAKKQVPVLDVISNSFAIKEFEQAFDLLLCGKGCKIVLRP